MKFNLETADHRFLIQNYSAEGVLIAGQLYRESLIVTPNDPPSVWSPPAVQLLKLEDFATALQGNPEVLLLGTGSELIFPPYTLNAEFAQLRIGLEVMNTAAACRTFNVLAGESRRVTAAFIQNY